MVRLYIAPLPVKPTSVQGHYYIRKGKSNHLMSISELSDMYLRSMSSSWDAMPSEHSPEDISLEKVAAFAKRMNPDSPDDPMRVLRKLSLVKDGKPTNACYLAFATIQRPELIVNPKTLAHSAWAFENELKKSISIEIPSKVIFIKITNYRIAIPDKQQVRRFRPERAVGRVSAQTDIL